MKTMKLAVLAVLPLVACASQRPVVRTAIYRDDVKLAEVRSDGDVVVAWGRDMVIEAGCFAKAGSILDLGVDPVSCQLDVPDGSMLVYRFASEEKRVYPYHAEQEEMLVLPRYCAPLFEAEGSPTNIVFGSGTAQPVEDEPTASTRVVKE